MLRTYKWAAVKSLKVISFFSHPDPHPYSPYCNCISIQIWRGQKGNRFLIAVLWEHFMQKLLRFLGEIYAKLFRFFGCNLCKVIQVLREPFMQKLFRFFECNLCIVIKVLWEHLMQSYSVRFLGGNLCKVIEVLWEHFMQKICRPFECNFCKVI